MATSSLTYVGDQTNGHNGHTVEWEVRKVVAVMAVIGSISDAQSAYLAMPGATTDEWTALERVLMPVRKFILEGETPYVKLATLSEYRGTPTPEGDCADDALPFELRNQSRAAIRAMMVGDTKSEGENL